MIVVANISLAVNFEYKINHANNACSLDVRFKSCDTCQVYISVSTCQKSHLPWKS